MATKRCPDCGEEPGSHHEAGCDVARCLVTGRQQISCDEPHECGRDIWTGRWPGEADAIRLGWWVVLDPIAGWRRCSMHTPGSVPDLNRLAVEGRWDRKARMWRAPDEAD